MAEIMISHHIMMLTLTADYDEDNIDDYDRLMELSEGGQETA